MNIGYHYYTIKTLARKAGFSEDEAQIIAFYSQMIDDFVLSHKVILNACPPDFFMENGLAKQINETQWEFLPCATGIDFLRSLEPDFQRHTLASFHFIPAASLTQLESDENCSRLNYRCRQADLSEDMLIVQILDEAVGMVKEDRSRKNLMRLGMALHTFADTYAHCNFSGLHGFENEAVIESAVKCDGEPAVNEAEICLFKEVPAIGHGRIGTIPDVCTYTISYAIKKDSQGKTDCIVSRSNAEFFSECSRNILNVLCGITGAGIMGDSDWKILKENLIQAQTVKKDEKKYLTPSWQSVFPDIIYDYDKNKGFSLELEINGKDAVILEDSEGKISEDILQDVFSCKGNQIREGLQVSLSTMTPDFFDYNEIAYERVRKVTGEYSSGGWKQKI